jgi:neutral trehalase
MSKKEQALRALENAERNHQFWQTEESLLRLRQAERRYQMVCDGTVVVERTHYVERPVVRAVVVRETYHRPAPRREANDAEVAVAIGAGLGLLGLGIASLFDD